MSILFLLHFLLFHLLTTPATPYQFALQLPTERRTSSLRTFNRVLRTFNRYEPYLGQSRQASKPSSPNACGAAITPSPHLAYYCELRKLGLEDNYNSLTMTERKTARKLFTARKLIKAKKFQGAETVYRFHLDVLARESAHFDHEAYTHTTLLLILLLQKKKDMSTTKEVRTAFLSFFRAMKQNGSDVMQLGRGEMPGLRLSKATARVFQAFALFETKQNLNDKAFFLVKAAVEIDPELAPVMKWNRFKSYYAKHLELVA